jgi:hypothetical protein
MAPIQRAPEQTNGPQCGPWSSRSGTSNAPFSGPACGALSAGIVPNKGPVSASQAGPHRSGKPFLSGGSISGTWTAPLFGTAPALRASQARPLNENFPASIRALRNQQRVSAQRSRRPYGRPCRAAICSMDRSDVPQCHWPSCRALAGAASHAATRDILKAESSFCHHHRIIAAVPSGTVARSSALERNGLRPLPHFLRDHASAERSRDREGRDRQGHHRESGPQRVGLLRYQPDALCRRMDRRMAQTDGHAIRRNPSPARGVPACRPGRHRLRNQPIDSRMGQPAGRLLRPAPGALCAAPARVRPLQGPLH